MARKHPIIREALVILKVKRSTLDMPPLSFRETRRFSELLTASIRKFRQLEADLYSGELNDSFEILSALHRALAVHISANWNFDSDDEFAPSGAQPTAEAVQDWIEADWEIAKGYLEASDSFFERSLMLLIDEAENRYNYWYFSQDLIQREHWAFMDFTKSRLPEELQELVYELCLLWHEYADRSLGLPRRNSETDNPLIRYANSVLFPLLADKCPTKSTLHTLIQDHIRPIILKNAGEDTDFSGGGVLAFKKRSKTPR